MVINNNVVQDWTENELNLLEQAIVAHTGISVYTDIVLVGSRVMGFHKDTSDIDFLILLPTFSWSEDSAFTSFMFEGVKVSGAKRPSQDFSTLLFNFQLPCFSLGLRQLYYVDSDGINDWLDFRIQQKQKLSVDFMENRTTDKLIVSRTQKNKQFDKLP